MKFSKIFYSLKTQFVLILIIVFVLAFLFSYVLQERSTKIIINDITMSFQATLDNEVALLDNRLESIRTYLSSIPKTIEYLKVSSI